MVTRLFASASARLRWIVAVTALTLVTVGSFVAVTLRLHLEPNVASLLPERGDAAALRRYARAFGGGDLAVVMVKGEDPDKIAEAAATIAHELAAKPSVLRAADRIDVSRSLDPMLAFRHADARARARLAQILTPEGMRERLRETRSLLLVPGSGSLADIVVNDPLRLAQAVFETGGAVGAGVRTQPDGGFATNDGKMHLVLVQPRGQALRGADARAFVSDANAVLDAARAKYPGLTFGLTGGHAIAAASEVMLTRDLELSGTVAMILASVLFVIIFRRTRALVAVMPPLVLGTIWTAGLATILPGGLSAIAVAFMSVVVGVGVDTGVHVYAALLEARRQGYDPAEAARIARARTQREVLIAAVTAGFAFGALALSDIVAVQQFGLLSGAGEILTAIAIVIVTPEVGAWLEKGPPPSAPPSQWTRAVDWLTRTKTRSLVLTALALVPIVALARGAAPPLAEAVVAIRPSKLEPLRVQQQVFDAFGGKKGQWVVLVADADLDRARLRGDRIAERLASMPGEVEAVDALTALAPAPDTQTARFAARDALNLPAKADELERALGDLGFAPQKFASAIANMRAPSTARVELSDIQGTSAAILTSRYVSSDAGEHLVAIYLQPREEPDAMARLEQAIRETDTGARLTGYSRLDASLKASLRHDIPRIGAVALVLVVIAMAASLRSVRDVVLATLVILSEIAAVLVLIRVLHIPLHAYDALVIPVLLGVTVDEGMFLLHRARMETGDVIADTLRHEGPSIAATALTTAAGFAALGFCDFDGLRDLGWVGALGSTVGLVVALVIVPAGLRLTGGARHDAAPVRAPTA